MEDHDVVGGLLRYDVDAGVVVSCCCCEFEVSPPSVRALHVIDVCLKRGCFVAVSVETVPEVLVCFGVFEHVG